MATEVRERGNSLYKQGKLPEAIKCYEEAASLAPKDPAPVSNLSAANFEMGKYRHAAELAQRALSLTDDKSPSRAKLYLRLARCHLYDLNSQQTREVLEECGELPGKCSVEEALALTDGVADTQELRRRVLDRLPRYKPCLQDEPGYYPIGHDVAESLLDPKVADNSNQDRSLSFLCCGIGDARHLWATLTGISLHIRKRGDVLKELHFTLVDLKPASLARILIMLRLLSQLLPSEQSGPETAADARFAIAYLYIGHVLPPFVHTALLKTISDLMRVLEKNSPKDPLLELVVMPEATRVQVLEHLRLWSRPLDSLYSPENVRRSVKATIRDSRLLGVLHGFTAKEPAPPTCEKDDETFDKFTIIPPPKDFIQRHEPQIGPLLDLTRPTSLTAPKQAPNSTPLDEYINQHWKANMTLWDLMWEGKKERNNYIERPSDMAWTKMTRTGEELAIHLKCVLGDMDQVAIPEASGIIEMMALYFFVVGNSLDRIRKRSKLRVEMIAGEMTDFMESLRYDCVADRAGKGASASFPKRFDRIHMSNIPDYVGGVFAPLEYARPLLKDGNSSFQYSCLLNPPKFKSQEHFLSEHILMRSKQDIRDHFCAELFDQYGGQQDISDGDFYLGQQYWAWKPSGTASELPWAKLMSRARVERWLYAHFLKICLPACRKRTREAADDAAPVCAPLNLSALMRLIVRLAERGYPAHWLGTLLENLTSGLIKTTARAPRKEAMDVEDVGRLYHLRQMTVAPWVTEFTTLVGIWRGLMPFGFVVAHGAHVALADVCEYSISFPDFTTKRDQLRVPHFVLVFFNAELGELPQSLRSTLLDDEVGDSSAPAKKARAGGLHIVTTFTYVTDTRTASF